MVQRRLRRNQCRLAYPDQAAVLHTRTALHGWVLRIARVDVDSRRKGDVDPAPSYLLAGWGVGRGGSSALVVQRRPRMRANAIDYAPADRLLVNVASGSHLNDLGLKRAACFGADVGSVARGSRRYEERVRRMRPDGRSVLDPHLDRSGGDVSNLVAGRSASPVRCRWGSR